MTINQRLTLIQDLVRAEKAEAKKRAKLLKALKNSIIDNEFNRTLKEDYGDGPYSIKQLFTAKYRKSVEKLSVNSKSILSKVAKFDWVSKPIKVGI